MLVLQAKEGSHVTVNETKVIILSVHNGKVKLGFEGPDKVTRPEQERDAA